MTRREFVRWIEINRAKGSDVTRLEAMLHRWDKNPVGMARLIVTSAGSKKIYKRKKSKPDNTTSVQTTKDNRGRKPGTRKATMKKGKKQ